MKIKKNVQDYCLDVRGLGQGQMGRFYVNDHELMVSR
jgi:hypothetical protein